jgi:hypothetical protein
MRAYRNYMASGKGGHCSLSIIIALGIFEMNCPPLVDQSIGSSFIMVFIRHTCVIIILAKDFAILVKTTFFMKSCFLF